MAAAVEHLSAQTVVVGSGPGGATVARELARLGPGGDAVAQADQFLR